MCLLCFYLRINNMDDFRAPVAEHRTPNIEHGVDKYHSTRLAHAPLEIW